MANAIKYFSVEIQWTETSDVDFPYQATIAGQNARVRINDFPDEVMYTLFVGNNELQSFNDWPENWSR